jgi:cell division protein FtsB
MISTIVLMGALFFCVIFLMAYGASIQRDLNHANSEMVSVKDDIDNLTLAIERGQNVGAIERKAADELGMIHPGETQLKYLAELELEPTDMAQSIREKAYGA